MCEAMGLQAAIGINIAAPTGQLWAKWPSNWPDIQVVTTPTTPTPTQALDETPAPKAQRELCRFDDTSLRAKAEWMLAAAVLWGGVVGFAAGSFDWGVAGLLMLCGILALVAAMVGRNWIAKPVEDLVAQTGRITHADRPTTPRRLPCDRSDEVGELARAIHQLAVAAYRDHAEAQQLRRTLDQRVEHATRKATAQLTHMAMRDPLTNLGNRRFIDQNLDELIESCQAARLDLICIAIDLDHFKQVNDQLGHAAGDELIKFAGSLAKALTRDGDWVIRLGGDEFVVLMAGSDLTRAASFIEHTHAMFREHVSLHLPEYLKVDMSMGVASLQRDKPQDGAGLLRIADEHLYAAKESGKGTARGV